MIPLNILQVPCSVYLILFGVSKFLSSSAANETQTVNILLVHQEGEPEKLFNVTLSYLENNPSLNVKTGTVHRYYADGSDSVKFVSSFCSFVDKIMALDDKPDIAIDFTRGGVSSEAVKVVLKTIQMPTISATFGQEGDLREWRNLDPKQEKYLIQVSPPADILVQSVRSIAGKQSMSSAAVLFDESYEMGHKHKSLLKDMPTRHILTKIQTGDKLTAQIVKLAHVDIGNFFIAATPNEITEVLVKASNPNAPDGPYFSEEFAWYSMSLTPGKPKCTGCQMAISVVHLSPVTFKRTTGKNRRSSLEVMLEKADLSLTEMFYFDLSIDAILAVADLKKQGIWTHDISNNTCATFTGANVYPFLDLDLFEAFKKSGSTNSMGAFHLEKNGRNFPNFNMQVSRLLFKPDRPAPYSDEDLGYWTAGFGETELVEFRGGKDLVNHLAMTIFRVVTVVQPPFVYRVTNCSVTDRYANCFKGYCIDLMDKISADLRFNYTIREVASYGYMNWEFPHEWDGMIRELKDRKADIALGALSVMPERESVVDFTVPYYDLVGFSILMKKPKTVTSLFKFLTVLENEVWLCIVGAYLFTSLFLWIFDRGSPYSYQNNLDKYEDDDEKRVFTLKECLWFCMTSLTPQGGGEAPKNLSGRLVAATWWLFGFIIIASYTANLAAFLTVSRLDAPIESLEDLSKQTKIQYAPMVGSSAYIYFNRMAHIEHRFYEIWKDMSLNDSLTDFARSHLAVWEYPVSDKFTKMWNAMQENEPPAEYEDAINRVRARSRNRRRTDQFAFIDEATNIKYQTIIGCEFEQIGEEFSQKPYALAVQKGSPLKESLSNVIMKLMNQRYLEQLKESWWGENPFAVTCPADGNQSDGISIYNIGGVFIIIFIGSIMASVTVFIEYWWYRKRNIPGEIIEMPLPPPTESGSNFSPTTIEKTNFNTQYNK